MTVTTATRGRVIIIGGSMAGLFAAVSLRAQGWQVAVYERAGEALANRGAGIATHDGLYAAVRAAGIERRDEMGVHSLGRIMLGPDGRVIGTHDMLQLMTSLRHTRADRGLDSRGVQAGGRDGQEDRFG